MPRQNWIVIRLSDAEREAIEKVATRSHLPPSTWARQQLVEIARQRGYYTPESPPEPAGRNGTKESAGRG